MLSVLVGLKKKRKCSFGGTRALSISVKRKRQDDAYLELMKLRKSNLGKTLNHDIETIVLSHNDPYVTRSSLNYLFKKRNTDEIPVVVETHYDFANRDIGHLEQMDITNSNVQLPMEVVNIVVNEDIVSDVSNVSSRIESMQEQNDEEQSDEMVNSVSELTSGSKSLIQRCTTIASERYVHAREKADKEGNAVKRNTLKGIIDNVEKEFKIKSGTLQPKTIAGRAYNGNLTGFNKRNTSPLYAIEPAIVSIILEQARHAETMGKTQVIELARSMSKGTIHAKRYNDHMKVERPQSTKLEDEVANIGEKWYRGFKKRHAAHLKTSKSKTSDSKRSTYVTKDNFASMYDDVYDALHDAGIAKKMNDTVMLDKKGNMVDKEEEMVGLPTKFIMEHPRNFIFMDETGCNTNQKTDGFVGGEEQLVPADNSGAGNSGSTTDMHFTVLAFTNGLGEPVCCAVIFKSKQTRDKIPIYWKLGIDRTMAFKGDPTNADDIADNMDNHNNMTGGPNCYIGNKVVPSYYGCSPNASITGEMLHEILLHIDENGAIDRTNGKLPVLLCDGHHSRYNEHFQNYIHGEGHKWKVVIGVPYGTHVRQVADSSQLNGCFKMALTKAKRNYRLKVVDEKKDFVATDIVPLLNYAWKHSFARTESAKHAIEQRGWGPLNYALLRSHSFKENAPIHKIASMVPMSCATGILNFSMNVNGYCGELVAEMGYRAVLEKAAIKARQEKRTSSAENARKFKTLKETIGGNIPIRSGVLFQNRHSVMTEEMRDIIAAKAADKEKKATLVADNKKNKEQKKKEKYVKSLTAFRTNPEKLCAADYSTLIQNLAVMGDSPVKKSKNELVEQFNRRNCPIQLSEMLFGTEGRGLDGSIEAGGTTSTSSTVDMESNRSIDAGGPIYL
jgi:hypothetical protein